MNNLKQFVANCYQDDIEHTDVLPSAALLTGVNQPDHYKLFKTFAHEIQQQIASHVCIIQSRDCPNMKAAIETLVTGLMVPASAIDQFEVFF